MAPGTEGSLLFSFVDVDDQVFPACDPGAAAKEHHAVSFNTIERILALCRPPVGFASRLLRDVRHLKRQLLQDDDRLDVVLLGAQLAELGYSVCVRCALGGAQPAGAAASPGNCFRNLRHEFLFVRCESGDHAGVEFLVDPCFRDQFAIPQPTAAFRQLLASVPQEFVGTSMRLQTVVELLCTEMAASFEARGLTTPPWRRPAAMLSKFFPKAVKDIAVTASRGNSPPLDVPMCSPPPAFQLPLPHQLQLQQYGMYTATAGQQPGMVQTPPMQGQKEAARQLATLWQAGYHDPGSPTFDCGEDSSPLVPALSLAPITTSAAPTTETAPAAPNTAQQLQQRAQQGTTPRTSKPEQAALPPAQAAQHASAAQLQQQREHQQQREQVQAQVELRLQACASSPPTLMALDGLAPVSAVQQAMEPQLFARLSEPPTLLQRRISGPVSLLSAQLAGNGSSNPTSPTAGACFNKSLQLSPPSQALGSVSSPFPLPQPHALPLEQQQHTAQVPAAGLRQHAASGHLNVGTTAAPSGAAHPAAPRLLFVTPPAPATATPTLANRCAAPAAGQLPAAGGHAAAMPSGAATGGADTVHISWCGGVIHKVKPRGVPA